ncbi:sporulation integral membrane protein YlbJ [Moorella sulfitireducens (nom. illeg.)]|uniref:sporulation integral membrane protein YlbJ n=1 Tax=Neomoorella sulfitireducens TaxID=2972948 RepID=UPI0021AC82E4|nr:sporulation integral membrane protein YlbJ [Moorella sulfitireducens]
MRHQVFIIARGLGPFLTVAAVMVLALAIVLFPQDVFQAALRGLKAWWEIVVPALLPFFIISQLFMGLGIVHFLGVLLEPVMRPLFNVPGNGAFVMAMGYTSGSPISAILTAQLRQQGLVTRVEGERLICFTSNASPLFMLGAVAVGMLHDPALGPVLAGAHYGANFFLGTLFRFYGCRQPASPPASYNLAALPRRAWQAMVRAQQKDGRPLGQLLGDAVNRSFLTLITIGGFIILFSVIIQVASILGVLGYLAKILFFAGRPFGLSREASLALAAGIFEMTMGAKIASEAPVPVSEQLAAISLIMGWAGLSILGQVAAMVSQTDLRLGPFIAARLLHGFLAALLVRLCQGPARPVLLLLAPGYTLVPGTPWLTLWLHYTWYAFILMLLLFLLAALGFGARYFLYRRP